MGLIAKPPTARPFSPHSYIVEQIISDLESSSSLDPLNPFALSLCAPTSPLLPPPIPDPPISLTNFLHSQNLMSAPSPSDAPSSSSPPRRPRKKPRNPSSVRFACPKCPSTFSRKDNLATHSRVHTGERPYSCRFCARTFMWPSSARTHELTHQRNARKRRGRLPGVEAPAGSAGQNPSAAPVAAGASVAPVVPVVPVAPVAPVVPSVPVPQAPQAPHYTATQAAFQPQPPHSSGAPLAFQLTTSPISRSSQQPPLAPQSQHPQQPQHQRWMTNQVSFPPALPVAAVPTANPARPMPPPLGLAPTPQTAAEAEVDPVHANVLATLDGLIPQAGVPGVSATGPATTPQAAVVEGESPMFGACMGRMSQVELERHMEDLFSDGAAAHPHGETGARDGRL